ncbi:choice-of-anchor I domain-containing protein [Streptomyces sp. NPDC001635]
MIRIYFCGSDIKQTMNCKKLFGAIFIASLAFAACKKDSKDDPIVDPPVEAVVPEKIDSFKETASIDLGGEFASEISAYDPLTKKLFVASNDGGAKVDVVDMSKYPTVTKMQTLTYAANAGINSVAVNNGLLAIALDGADKQGNGDILVLKTSDLSEVKKITVGAMPDMVTFSPDGNYILSANEGEPNPAYTVNLIKLQTKDAKYHHHDENAKEIDGFHQKAYIFLPFHNNIYCFLRWLDSFVS